VRTIRWDVSNWGWRTKRLPSHRCVLSLGPVARRAHTLRCTAGEDQEESSAGDIRELRKDIISVLGWIAVAAAVGAGVWIRQGAGAGLEFFTAYVVEYSLSVDNLFVFLLLFDFFKVPRHAQEKVLGFGVAGAMFMRFLFIFAGVELERRFWWIRLIFSVLLTGSALKILSGGEEDDEVDTSKNPVIRFSSQLVSVSDRYHGDQFWVRSETGVRLATPLFVCLLSIELSDIVFALDSVPACLAISKSLFVVYSSNILAILGLRSLFFVVEDALANLRYLKPSLALVLGFVGAKMAAGVAGWELGTLPSLLAIVAILGGGIGVSLLAGPKSEEETR